MKKTGQWKILCRDNAYLPLADKIIHQQYTSIQFFKNDKRSAVQLIDIDGQQYILKEPTEKNRRKWQQFLNTFRDSDSFRSFYAMEKLLEMGFNGPKPILAVQKHIHASSSYLLMEYVQGTAVSSVHYTEIIRILHAIHQNGVLHGDTNLCNFIAVNESVFLIDCALKKNWLGPFGTAFDFVFMSEDMEGYRSLYGDMMTTFPYKVAEMYREFGRFLRRLKRRLRNK